MRLFAAVWPPDAVLDHLERALTVVRGGLDEPQDDTEDRAGHGGLRWSARETWHLTAAFYGDLPPGALDELGAELADVAHDVTPFELHLRGAGVFSHRTLWVGVGGDVDAMSSVAARSVRAGAAVGARPDDRVRSRPHLTVGRVRPPSRRVRALEGRSAGRDDVARGEDLVRALAVYEGPAWTAEELLLVESRPGAGRGGGPLYTVVERHAFAG